MFLPLPLGAALGHVGNTGYDVVWYETLNLSGRKERPSQVKPRFPEHSSSPQRGVRLQALKQGEQTPLSPTQLGLSKTVLWFPSPPARLGPQVEDARGCPNRTSHQSSLPSPSSPASAYLSYTLELQPPSERSMASQEALPQGGLTQAAASQLQVEQT